MSFMRFILSLAIISVGGHAQVCAVIKAIPVWVSQPVQSVCLTASGSCMRTVSEWHGELDSINKLSDNKNFSQFLFPISFSICSLDFTTHTQTQLFVLLSSVCLCNLQLLFLNLPCPKLSSIHVSQPCQPLFFISLSQFPLGLPSIPPPPVLCLRSVFGGAMWSVAKATCHLKH